MAMIAQKRLFDWQEIETSSDLDRLRMVLEAIADEPLMRGLEQERKKRRDDYPIRALWNSVLAGIVFQHASVESLRRELSRNGELRSVCGFDPSLGQQAVPPAWVYTRFLRKLLRHEALLQEMFDGLVERLTELLPDFGKRLAIDGKELPTHARKRGDAKSDGRSDKEAAWGVKKYTGQREDGTLWERVKKWFGYQVLLLVDTEYELPVAFEVTKASAAESPRLLPLVEKTQQRHRELLAGTEYLSGDKGYDAAKTHITLWEEYPIKGVIDIREMWKDEKGGSRPLYPERADTIVYTEKGEVLCRYQDTDTEAENYTPLAFEGFEADRLTLKYRCPAAAKGIACTQKDFCNGGSHPAWGRIVRIPLDTDRRIFTPVARGTPKWEREYDHRTAVERVNSRIDNVFGFEQHYIRGQKKMQIRMNLALIVMLSMAVGRIQANQKEYLRSLLKAA
jgi:hypothetical protein